MRKTKASNEILFAFKALIRNCEDIVLFPDSANNQLRRNVAKAKASLAKAKGNPYPHPPQ